MLTGLPLYCEATINAGSASESSPASLSLSISSILRSLTFVDDPSRSPFSDAVRDSASTPFLRTCS
jgi:hypothetical protein